MFSSLRGREEVRNEARHLGLRVFCLDVLNSRMKVGEEPQATINSSKNDSAICRREALLTKLNWTTDSRCVPAAAAKRLSECVGMNAAIRALWWGFVYGRKSHGNQQQPRPYPRRVPDFSVSVAPTLFPLS